MNGTTNGDTLKYLGKFFLIATVIIALKAGVLGYLRHQENRHGTEHCRQLKTLPGGKDAAHHLPGC